VEGQDIVVVDGRGQVEAGYHGRLRQEKPASQIAPNLLKFAQIQPFATFDNPPHEYAQI
jgi:hypothetical protein